MAEADWSQLPKELLQVIAERLDSALYLLRFRSVCSSWRSSILNHHHQFPSMSPFPFLSYDAASHESDSRFSLSKRSLFLISAPEQTLSVSNPNRPWLIKIGEDARGRIQLWNPLSRFPITPNLSSPQVLDLYELPVFDLSEEYVLNDMGFRSFNSLYMEKVVFTWLGSESEDFVLLTIHVSGKLAFFKSGDMGWTIIPDMPTPYDDVCVFRGKLYAVDNTGRTVLVGMDSSVSLVAESVFGGDKKFLVESEGELLLVDKYLSSDFLCSLGVFEEDEDEIYELGCEKAVKFDVFKLDVEGKRWVELRSLGDRILFMGDDSAFSASASDLSVGTGNCVIFRDDTFNVNALESGMGVFHLDEGRICPLSDYPGYAKLFWPPPDWVRFL